MARENLRTRVGLARSWIQSLRGRQKPAGRMRGKISSHHQNRCSSRKLNIKEPLVKSSKHLPTHQQCPFQSPAKPISQAAEPESRSHASVQTGQGLLSTGQEPQLRYTSSAGKRRGHWKATAHVPLRRTRAEAVRTLIPCSQAGGGQNSLASALASLGRERDKEVEGVEDCLFVSWNTLLRISAIAVSARAFGKQRCFSLFPAARDLIRKHTILHSAVQWKTSSPGREVSALTLHARFPGI